MTDNKTTVNSDENNVTEKAQTFMFYSARSFKRAFDFLVEKEKHEEYTGPSEQLILPILFTASHAAECYFKAYLIFKGATVKELKKDYGHDLVKLYKGCESQGILKVTAPDGTEEYQIQFAQESFLTFKPHLDNIVRALHEIHNRTTEYANRYLDKVPSGYLVTFSNLSADLGKLDQLCMHHMDVPRVRWTDHPAPADTCSRQDQGMPEEKPEASDEPTTDGENK